MKKSIIFSMILLATFSLNVAAQNNMLSAREKLEGWILMFDGKSFDGWRGYNGTVMPSVWSIDEEQQAMKIAPAANNPGGRPQPPPRVEGAPRPAPNDIIYAGKKFLNFELSIDWKVDPRANSGIFYYVQEIPGQSIFASGIEVQILDNCAWPPTDNRATRNMAGSLYDMKPALPPNAKCAGEWNNIRIWVKDGVVEHIQNGVKVVEYTIWTDEWAELLANSKFATWQHFGKSRTGGFIGLQDHNDFSVWFRNIKIREL